MDLIKFLNILPKDIVSIVGAGGKTSLLFTLSQNLSNKGKVLTTTTTKIYKPNKSDFSNIFTLDEINNESIDINEEGAYVIGRHINSENKMVGLNKNQIDKLTPHFNYIFIEADGSKGKSLKGWKNNEPVVYEKTTKTIGVLDVKTVGIKINEGNIHGMDKFIEITKSHINEEVKIKHLANLILHKEGLFKYSKGENILFINKVEDDMDFENAEILINVVKSLRNKTFHKIIYGSILNNKYYKG